MGAVSLQNLSSFTLLKSPTKVKNLAENAKKKGYSAIACKLVNFADESEILEVGSTLRVFKKDKNIRFERAIHEVLFDKEKNEPISILLMAWSIFIRQQKIPELNLY